MHKKQAVYQKRWNSKNKARLAEIHRNWRRNVRKKVLAKLGGKCNNPACQWLNADGTRGCTDERCLQVDHVFGGGTQENLAFRSRYTMYKKVLADTEGRYQLLCANCNWIKRHVNEEY